MKLRAMLTLLADQPPARQRMALAAVLGRDGSPSRPGAFGESALPESLEAFTRRAAAAFESDMQPVCNAIVSALKAEDEHALRGLRALLPHLLTEVNAQPALADLLAHQLGKSLMEGFNAEAAETQKGNG